MKLIKYQLITLLALLSQSLFIMEINAAEASTDTATSQVVFETSMGSYTLELYPDKAPKTVANFLQYIDDGFYSKTLFHRVIPRFVAQAGGFTSGMQKKKTRAPVVNESDNGLMNTRATISMARTRDPDSASSQFFINADHNPSLDYRKGKPGYTVFGKVIEGMDVVDKIIKSPTKNIGRNQNVPATDILILSAHRKGDREAFVSNGSGEETKLELRQKSERYLAGEHYTVLELPVAPRDKSKIEVVELFSYGCPHCYEMEDSIKAWRKKHNDNIDFWVLPAVWNKSMKLFARAFYVSQELNVIDKTHMPLFSEIVVKQKKLSNEQELAGFYEAQGVDKNAVLEAFKSAAVREGANQSELRTHLYKPSGVPEIIINGKYRIDRMRAGSLAEMLAVADFLIDKERELLDKE